MAGVRVKKERSLSAVWADLKTGRPARNCATWRNAVHISPRAHARGTAKEVSHHVVGGGACGIIDPAYGLAVGLEPQAVAGSEQGEGASVRQGQQVGWVKWGRGSGHEHFMGA